MPKYRYHAIDSLGKWVSGEVEGAGRDEVDARLQAEGLIVETLTEAEPKPQAAAPAMSRKELVELVEQLTTLIRSGLPLPSGLRAAGEEMVSASLRSTFFDLADRLESGVDLDQALASNRDFPPYLRGLMLAGSRTGRLADVLGEYVRSANLGSELRRLFWATLAYPLFALAIVMVLVGFVCTLSVKAVDSLIGELPNFGQQVPKSQSVMVGLARLLNDQGLEIVAAFAVFSLMTWLAIRVFLTPAGRRRLYCSIPVIGPILRFTSLTEFCHLLGLFVEAGLPLPLAFELAGSSVRDSEVAEACGRMGRAVEAGEPLSSAVRLWDSIPAGLGQLFRWSEDRRSLPEALHLAGDMFESRARSQSNFASGVLATFLLLLILWWVGFALASLYLPMISLISRLSG